MIFNKIKINNLLILSIVIIFYVILLVKNNNQENFNIKPLSSIINKFFVITLNETEEGKKRMNKLKKNEILGKYITKFNGIYGKKYDYNNEIKQRIIKKTWDYGLWNNKKSQMVEMSDGEIGCCLSHYYLWKKIVDEKIPITMILEDDCDKLYPNFENIILKLIKIVPKDWDIFLIGYWLHKGNDGEKINEYIYKVKNFALTHCYIITYKGAKKLLNSLPINMPVDSWLSSQSNNLNIYRHNLAKNKNTYPYGLLIRQKKILGSQIHHTNNFIRNK